MCLGIIAGSVFKNASWQCSLHPNNRHNPCTSLYILYLPITASSILGTPLVQTVKVIS